MRLPKRVARFFFWLEKASAFEHKMCDTMTCANNKCVAIDVGDDNHECDVCGMCYAFEDIYFRCSGAKACGARVCHHCTLHCDYCDEDVCPVCSERCGGCSAVHCWREPNAFENMTCCHLRLCADCVDETTWLRADGKKALRVCREHANE